MKEFLTLVFTVLMVQGIAQIRISGNVFNGRGEVIPGVNVFIENTYDGGSTNAQGEFEFNTTETGSKILMATCVGFKPCVANIDIQRVNIRINLTLEEEISELQAVTISAGAFTASDVSRKTVFRAIDIATTAGATADVAGALNSLPGTQKVGETGRLFVRGGDGNETRTFIDGMVVMDAYGPAAPNTPSRGRFLPFMFKGMSFSTGGYSAEFGQALSSALVLDSKDKGELTRTDFGILSVGGDVGHTQVWEKGSVAGKVQYTNLRSYTRLIRQEIDWKNAPVSVEGSTAFRHTVGNHGLIKLYGNFNTSDFSLYRHNIDDERQKALYDLQNTYSYLNGFYSDVLNENLSIRSGVSYTLLQNKVHADTLLLVETQKGLHFKTVLEGSISEHVEFKSGIEVITRAYNEKIDHDFAGNFRAFDERITSFFSEADIFVSNRFIIRPGFRVEHLNLNNDLSIDPRLSIAHKIGSYGQASFAFGKFRQSAATEFLKMNEQMDTEEADHYMVNYQYSKGSKILRLEGFLKRYSHLIKHLPGRSSLTNDGSGFAQGAEIFWRDNGSISSLDYWISYSFLDTKRNYLDFPHAAMPSFASKHNLSVVAKYFVQSWKSQIGFTYSLTSGRPYRNPNGNGFLASRTPNYADLSFNWSYLPTTSVIVYFSCTNILGRDNIFGYEYGSVLNAEGEFNARPIRQAAPRFLFLGIFITLSKDKSVNQLPTL